MFAQNGYYIDSPAKINLFLKVIKKTNDNYHELQSLITFVNFYDRLSFSIANTSSLVIRCAPNINNSFAENTQTNLIMQVIKFVIKYFGLKHGIQANLYKAIPIGGGLGGGSSNAAATLVALNKLLNLKLSFNEILEIGFKFGSDIPLFIYHFLQGSNLLFLEGVGDKITPYKAKFNLPTLLINPNTEVSTKKVFSSYIFSNHGVQKLSNNDISVDSKDMLLNLIYANSNDLTDYAIKLEPKISQNLQLLKQTNALVSRMSGSGSTSFAIYESEKELLIAKKKINQPEYDNWTAITRSCI